jgi:hypothetical protein
VDVRVAVRVGARVAGIVVRLACKVITDGDAVRIAESVGEGNTIVAVAVASGV